MMRLAMKSYHVLIAGTLAFAAGLFVSFSSVTAASGEASRPPYASKEPMPEPTIFAEGVVSTGDFESHPAFTPDGRTLYFLKNSPTFNFWTIVVTYFKNNRWSAPEVASFSGQYRDADPFITSDGSKFYFISDRPKAVPNIKEEEKSLDIWLMEKVGNGWGAPKNLGAPVNSSGSEWYPTVALDGTLYFGSDRAGGKGSTDIYRSRLVDGKYMEPENLGDAINTQFDEFEPYIAPDQTYLIFMAARPDGRGGSDLYISHQRGGTWTKAVNLGDKINSNGSEYSPKVSPDGKYFFWSSTRGLASTSQPKRFSYAELLTRLRSPRNGLGDIYQIDISMLNIQP
jgi:Tol biopolymer transport system component